LGGGVVGGAVVVGAAVVGGAVVVGAAVVGGAVVGGGVVDAAVEEVGATVVVPADVDDVGTVWATAGPLVKKEMRRAAIAVRRPRCVIIVALFSAKVCSFLVLLRLPLNPNPG
jgi:hypothetical protein